jgi:holo-[acyl-carrier protein] synthase
MIFGIGTDIVEVERIRKLDSLEKFADKILSLNELEVFKSQIDEKKVTFLAKQFAAKEAVSKALGTGIGKDIRFNQIEILRNSDGKPYLNHDGIITTILNDLGITKTHVSLSDEKKYVLAFVVLEI